MGLDRIVAYLQGVDSNYRTDLFMPLMDKFRELTGATLEEMNANFTPYRVVADHARASTFLIADGVVPGNTGQELRLPHDHPARCPFRKQTGVD